jgi:hypothetical protein
VAAAWVAAAVPIAGILLLLLRLTFQVGRLVQRMGDHVTAADRVHADQEQRIRRLETAPGRMRR